MLIERTLMNFNPRPRTILASALLTATLITGAAVADVATSQKTVTIEVNGVARPVATHEKTVQAVLNDAGIEYAYRDEITPALNTAIKDGEKINIRTAREMSFLADGKTVKRWVTDNNIADMLNRAGFERLEVPAQRSNERENLTPIAPTGAVIQLNVDGQVKELKLSKRNNMRALLTEAGITLNPLDEVVTHNVDGKLTVTVRRVTRGNVTATEKIPFETEERKTDKLREGEKEVETEGKDGVRTIIRYQQKVDGKLLVNSLVSDKITTQPQKKVVLIGTRKDTPADDAANGAASIAGVPRGPYTGDDPRALAAPMVSARGWGDGEYQCLLTLWQRESNWNPYAMNASSGAYGIPQSLPGNKMASAGADWQTNPVTQITWGLGYIANRYGTPCGALGHSNRVGWY